MNRRILIGLGVWLTGRGVAQILPPTPGSEVPERREPEDQKRLPNGKLQSEAILKEGHKKALEDAAELVRLTGQLQTELEKNDQHVLSLGAIKLTEDIEKVSRRLRGRLRRS